MEADTLVYIGVKDLKKLLGNNGELLLKLLLKTNKRWRLLLLELNLPEYDVIKAEDLRYHLATYNGIIKDREVWYEISNLDIILIPDTSSLKNKLDSNPSYIDLMMLYYDTRTEVLAKINDLIKTKRKRKD